MSDNQDWKASRVSIEEYKNIQGWMINDKYLDAGCCRDVFAIIYGYSSKSNEQYCTFTVSHMADMIPCDRRTISSMINYLLDIGYIGRKPINGKRYKYWALNEEQIEKLNSERSYKDTISAINGKKFPIKNNGKNSPVNGKNFPVNGKNMPLNGKDFPPKYNINKSSLLLFWGKNRMAAFIFSKRCHFFYGMTIALWMSCRDVVTMSLINHPPLACKCIWSFSCIGSFFSK